MSLASEIHLQHHIHTVSLLSNPTCSIYQLFLLFNTFAASTNFATFNTPSAPASFVSTLLVFRDLAMYFISHCKHSCLLTTTSALYFTCSINLQFFAVLICYKLYGYWWDLATISQPSIASMSHVTTWITINKVTMTTIEVFWDCSFFPSSQLLGIHLFHIILTSTVNKGFSIYTLAQKTVHLC